MAVALELRRSGMARAVAGASDGSRQILQSASASESSKAKARAALGAGALASEALDIMALLTKATDAFCLCSELRAARAPR